MRKETSQKNTALNSVGISTKISASQHLESIFQWPNLKNLSGGLNLSRGLKMVGSI